MLTRSRSCARPRRGRSTPSPRPASSSAAASCRRRSRKRARAVWVDARRAIVTDDQHTARGAADRRDRDARAGARGRAASRRRRACRCSAASSARPRGGATTTLGRGGSDYSAAHRRRARIGACARSRSGPTSTACSRPTRAIVDLAVVVPHLSFARSVGARVLRRQGAASEHDPAGGRRRHPGPDPEQPPARGGRDADHRAAARRTTGRSRRSPASATSPSSRSPPRGC